MSLGKVGLGAAAGLGDGGYMAIVGGGNVGSRNSADWFFLIALGCSALVVPAGNAELAAGFLESRGGDPDGLRGIAEWHVGEGYEDAGRQYDWRMIFPLVLNTGLASGEDRGERLLMTDVRRFVIRFPAANSDSVSAYHFLIHELKNWAEQAIANCKVSSQFGQYA